MSAHAQGFPRNRGRAGRKLTSNWSCVHWSSRCWPPVWAASQSSVSVFVCVCLFKLHGAPGTGHYELPGPLSYITSWGLYPKTRDLHTLQTCTAHYLSMSQNTKMETWVPPLLTDMNVTESEVKHHLKNKSFTSQSGKCCLLNNKSFLQSLSIFYKWRFLIL